MTNKEVLNEIYNQKIIEKETITKEFEKNIKKVDAKKIEQLEEEVDRLSEIQRKEDMEMYKLFEIPENTNIKIEVKMESYWYHFDGYSSEMVEHDDIAEFEFYIIYGELENIRRKIRGMSEEPRTLIIESVKSTLLERECDIVENQQDKYLIKNYDDWDSTPEGSGGELQIFISIPKQ